MVARAFAAMTDDQRRTDTASDIEIKSTVIKGNGLFDNPMVLAAKRQMSPEEQERYRKLGEEMYNPVDFENNVIDHLPPPMQEGIRYVEAAIRSGTLPSDLEKNEIQLLHEVRGEKWWEFYGFDDDDMEGVRKWKPGE